MTDEIEGGPLTRIITPISTALNRVGIAKIAAAIIVILVIGWYFSLPQPGALTVRVSGLDEGGGVQDAIVSLLTPSGESLGAQFTAITDSSGVVSFTNVPSGEIAIQTSAPDYEPVTTIIILESRESKTEEVKLGRDVALSLSPVTLRVSASETCVKEISISAENQGENSVDASLVANAPLASAIQSQTVTISPGATQNVTGLLDVSKTGLKKGSTTNTALRVSGTNERVNLELRVVDNPRVDVEPEHITCAADRQCQQIVTITNRGQTTLDNLRVEPSEGITNVLQGGDVERFYTSTSISPGAEAKFAVRIDASTSALGVITIKADCFEKQIDVKAG